MGKLSSLSSSIAKPPTFLAIFHNCSGFQKVYLVGDPRHLQMAPYGFGTWMERSKNVRS